jgi:GMP synthase (glutamine-hydrolysing)
MTKRVVLVSHGNNPPDDRVHTWLLQNGLEPDVRKPFAGDLLGDVDKTVVGTVIYGGKYNAFDAELHPFLNEEYRWIDACLKADLPMLGICQGAQMIAYHLGAEAGPLPESTAEFGYYRVDPVPGQAGFLEGPQWFTQAHFHTFDLPEGAVHLASSEAFPNQAFRYGDKVYGFQFHPEVTIEGLRRWQRSDFPVATMPGAQMPAEQTRLGYEHDQRQADWFYDFLGKLFGAAAAKSKAA